MKGSDEQENEKRNVNEVKTFSVPFALEAIKDNISITTNTPSSPSKPSKEQIIKQAFEFHSQGNISEASKYYQYFIQQGFKDYRVFSNYGVILNDNGKSEEAEKLQREAIKINPNFAEAYYNLGIILKDLGNLKEAELSTRKAIQIDPNFAEAYYNLGSILKDLCNLKEAELSTRKAIQILPNYAEAHLNLGIILKDLGRLEDAELSARKAIELGPDFAEAHCNLGNILIAMDKSDEAEVYMRKAIKIKPNFAEAYSSLGNILINMDKLIDAKSSIRKAIKLNPNFAEAHCSLGKIFADLGKLQDAEMLYREAIKLKPDLAEAYHNLSHTLLKRKQFKEGFNKYEWRWKVKDLNLNIGNRLETNKPEWRPDKKGRVLLWAEQGIGDEVLYASLIPELIKIVDQLIIQTDIRLIPLFKRTFGNGVKYISRKESINENTYDYQIAMGSLPKILRSSLISFKKSKKFRLNVDQDKSKKYRSKLIGKTKRKIVGISWKSTAKHKNMGNRFISLEQFIKGIFLPNICFVSLQYGEVDKEIDFIKEKYGIVINQIKEIDNFNDIDKLSSLIFACDEIVSVSNITVNLAGAIGTKCYTLLDTNSNWRFGVNNNYCYWFPSLKLFRRVNYESWDKCLYEIKKEL
ncbi:tetratricopeptide repeat protein [Prochlorococcus marinus]|uniref:tetratricopeptide repeat protein n=1 Tax=Prochlorococcus marinus TaxID=1219 RepID=UPI0022B512B2|nr:tetratricopeptide repeat protein [Prochlorococcus marinus]